MALNVDYKAVVTLTPTSGASEDRVVNDFYFRYQNLGAPTQPWFDNLTEGIRRFYDNTPPPSAFSVSQRLGGQIARGAGAGAAHQIAYYNIINNTTPLGPPAAVGSFNMLNGPSADELPSELAVTLTLTGNGYLLVAENGPGGTRPRARRRGRIYIGPLNQSCLSDVVNGEPRVSDNIRVPLSLSATALQAYVSANGWRWSLWSDTDNQGRDVNGGWIDNAFDVQRRRGQDASNRLTFVAL